MKCLHIKEGKKSLNRRHEGIKFQSFKIEDFLLQKRGFNNGNFKLRLNRLNKNDYNAMFLRRKLNKQNAINIKAFIACKVALPFTAKILGMISLCFICILNLGFFQYRIFICYFRIQLYCDEIAIENLISNNSILLIYYQLMCKTQCHINVFVYRNY